MSYYFSNDLSLKSEIKNKKIKIADLDLEFYTDNGVFSKNGLDFGTRSLLESISYEELKGDILDFGCGWGPIGITIKKKCNVNVDMVDVNLRSINLAMKNAKLNNVDVNIFESDIYSNVTKKYDYIITNPPIRVGKAILYKILFEAQDHLKENGKIILVISKNQGAKSLLKDLKETYEVEILNKVKEFYVFKCIKH